MIASNLKSGFIAQNVYLFCASEGLGTGARGWINKEELQAKLQLKPSQNIILA
jgi:nitroreductase